MMRVVGCPSCEQNIALEEFVPAAAVIQCPFCQAESAVADMAQPRLPVAIVLEMPAVEVSDDVPDSDDALDDQPLGEDGELRGALNLGRADADSAAAREEAEASENADATAVATEDQPESTSEAGEPDSEVAAEGDVPTEEGEAPAKPEPARSLTRRRRKRGPSMVALMVQVVLGGVIGIGGTILGLLWLPGSLRRDPFDVGFSIGKVAPWIVPAHYRPASTASSSGNGAEARQTNARNGSKPSSSRTKAAKTPTDDSPSVAELPPGEFERKMKELQTRLDEPENGKDESSDDLELPILGGADSTDDPAMEEDPLIELPDDSDADAEESTAKNGNEDANAEDNKPKDEPKDETETESEPTEEEPTAPSDDADPANPDLPAESTEPETKEEGEVAPAGADEPLESTEPPVDASAEKESSVLTKAVQASEELARVLGDKELPLAQRQEAAQSFYAAICDLSDVTSPAAIDTLVKAAGDQLHAQVIARGAVSFLDQAETVGKPLVVVGKVTSAKVIGPVIELKINLTAKEPREVVLIAKGDGDPPAQIDDEIVAIGFLTDCEATPIEGYDGTGKVLSQSRIGRIPAPAIP